MPKVYRPRMPVKPARRFKDAGDAAAELHAHYGDWTSGFASYARQINFALMAANWAVNGSTSALVNNRLALDSMLIAVLYLAFIQILMGIQVLALKRQHDRSNRDKPAWEKEFLSKADTEWPYPDICETLGRARNLAHFIGPLICGLLLIASFVIMLPVPLRAGEPPRLYAPISMPATPPTAAANACPACDQSKELAGIRLAVEQLAKTGTACCDIASSGPVTGIVEVGLRASLGWMVVSGLILAAGVLLILAGRRQWRAVGASIATVGAMTLTAGGLTLIKEVKIDSLFQFTPTVNVDHLLDIIRKESRDAGTLGPLPIGSIHRFQLGHAQQLEPSDDGGTALTSNKGLLSIADAWVQQRRQGRRGILVLVGATDRLPLSGAKMRQFDANAGLARARAEAVKQALIAVVQHRDPELAPRPEDIVILISGPSQTPLDADSSASARKLGYPDDRRVDAWVIWLPKTTR